MKSGGQTKIDTFLWFFNGFAVNFRSIFFFFSSFLFFYSYAVCFSDVYRISRFFNRFLYFFFFALFHSFVFPVFFSHTNTHTDAVLSFYFPRFWFKKRKFTLKKVKSFSFERKKKKKPNRIGNERLALGDQIVFLVHFFFLLLSIIDSNKHGVYILSKTFVRQNF